MTKNYKPSPKSYFTFVALLFTLWVPSVLANLTEDTSIYGYLAWRVEKVWDEPSRDGQGNISFADTPREIDIPSFNVMLQSKISEKGKFFINLDGGGGEEVSVRNVWGEYKINDAFHVRLGKMYRRFGLYNEQLDAVPTYMGIEPPELFDKDHLILSRETSAMIHGLFPMGDGDISYSISTDNGEGGATDEDNIPLGFDLRYDWNFGDYTVGISGYTSGGDTTSDVELGDGSPRSGVLPWMEKDDFSIFGGYAQFYIDEWQLQAAFWNASHDAVRDPNAVIEVVNNADIHHYQRMRFLLDVNAPVDIDNIDTDGDYDVKTWYVRVGYSFTTSHGEFVPYFQWDSYDNPETIFSKTYGGDAEAGLADDGKFTKGTFGGIYRPIPQLAVKLDFSTHFQTINDKDEDYSEVRFDVSYIFGQ